MLKNAFLYRVALYEPKNCSFPQNKRFSFTESFTNFTQSRFLTHKNFFCTCLSLLVSKTAHFHKPKAFLSHRPFLDCYPKHPFSTLHLPFAPPLTYCPPKNTAVLLISALTPCAVKPESRTDSNHCRRYPEKCSFQHSRLPDERRSLSQKHRIDRRFESSPESRGSQTSGVLLVLFVHAKSTKNVPFPGSFEVSQTSKQHTKITASRNTN